MRYLVILLFILPYFAEAQRSVIFRGKDGRYYRTRSGNTINQQNKRLKQQKEAYKEQYGRPYDAFGMDFRTRAIKEEDGVYAFVRGCGKLKIEPLSENEKEANLISKIKTGEALKVKMQKGKSCKIGHWERIYK